MLFCGSLCRVKNAVILHGKPSRERYLDPVLPKPHEAHWFPWIGARLLDAGMPASIPPLPEPYFPVYEDWKETFEAEEVNEDTGVVAYSAGAEFILRWLSTNKDTRLGRVVLVAPYCDYAGKYGDFSKYTLDEGLAERVGKLTVINSLDDSETIQRRTHEIIEALPNARLVEVDGYGHFQIGNNMTGPEFPVLLDELIR